MNLPRLAIRHHVTTLMAYVLALGFGLFSLSRLKLDLYPDISFPMVMAITRYTGAGPFDMETVVTEPIEAAVSSVESIKKVSSTSRNGLSVVTMEFDWGTDMDKAQTDASRALDWVTNLPDDVTKPLLFKFSTKVMPIVFMGAGSSVLNEADLRRVCEDMVKPRLERIEGVAAVDVIGGLQRQIRVNVDPRALASYSLGIDMVTSALRAGNLQVPGGLIRDGKTAFSVRTLGEFQSVKQIEEAIVTVKNGQVIRVSDVAHVSDSFKDIEGEVRVDGNPGVMLIIRKQSDANTVQTVRKVHEMLPRIVGSVPGDLTLSVMFDQAEFIEKSLSNLSSNALSALGLTVLVLLVFLRNIRSSLIVGISIPVSMVLTFSVMDAAGVTFNIISMAGLALAVGMLVDNSIVVLENIFRLHELGYDRIEAAEKGSSQVAMAITASTLTTVVVFVPVLFVPGIAGVMFNDMALTICFALSASIFVALTAVPSLSAGFLDRQHAPRRRVPRTVFDAIGSGLKWVEVKYAGILKWSLGHRKTVVVTAAALFLASIPLFMSIGVDFLPQSDDGRITFNVEHAVGTDLPTTMVTLHMIEGIVKQDVPERSGVFVSAGSGGSIGNVLRGLDMNSGQVQIKLRPLAERSRSKFEIQDALRLRLAKIPGIKYNFQQDSGPMAGGADIEVRLFGDDLDVLGNLADSIVSVAKRVPGAVDARSSLERGAPELQIRLDRDRLYAVGMTAAQVSGAVSTAIQGATATRLREAGDEYDIFVRFADEYRKSPEQLEDLIVASPAGALIPLRQVADVRREVAPIAITREDQGRIVTVSIGISGRDLGSVTADVEKAIKPLNIPNDVILEIGGGAEDQRESFQYLGLAILAGIVLVYIVMASQFESLVDPFIIGTTVPLSFIGVAIALFITGTSVSVMALLGMLMLVGVVVNNGIVLVDFTNQLMRIDHKELYEAAYEAGRVRMRPVLMTAATTVIGMFPMSLGIGESGEAWAPLARAVMGGLIVATALTLVVIPVVYTLFESVSMRFKAWKERRAARESPELSTEERATLM
jgi:HAE1 family hydrophobic/amphiphilic exporter-1